MLQELTLVLADHEWNMILEALHDHDTNRPATKDVLISYIETKREKG